MNKLKQHTQKLLYAFFISFSLCTAVSGANEPWAKQITGSYNVSKITSDKNGSTFVLGQYTGTIQLGTAMFTSKGGYDIFFGVYSESNGNYLWSRSLGGPGTDYAKDIEFDASCNSIWLVGAFTGTIELPNLSQFIDPRRLTSAGGYDIFVARYDLLAGMLQTYARGGGLLNDMGEGMGIYNKTYTSGYIAGTTYITGYTQGNVTFETFRPLSGTLLSSKSLANNTDGKNTFIAEIYASGDIPNVFQLGTCYDEDFGKDVVVDQDKYLYVTGTFNGHFDNYNNGGGTYFLSSPSYPDVYLWKVSSYGTYIWGRTLGGTNIDLPEEVVVNQNNNHVYTIGTTYSAHFFINSLNTSFSDESDMVNHGGSDIYIAGYNNYGVFVGGDLIGGPNQDVAKGIKLDNYEYIYAAGSFVGTANSLFGGAANNATGGMYDKDILLYKYNYWLNPVEKKTIGTSVSDECFDVTVTGRNQVVIAGYNGAQLTWGTTTPVPSASTFLANVGWNANGRYGTSSANPENNTSASEQEVMSVSPNPFEDNTKLQFTFTEDGNTNIELYSNAGQKVKDVFEGVGKSGDQIDVVLDGSDIKPGLYHLKVKTTSTTSTQKIVKK